MFGLDLGDADLFGDGATGGLVVARQHDDLDAQRAKLAHGDGARGPHLIAHAEDPNRARLVHEHHGRLAVLLEEGERVLGRLRAATTLLGELMAAEHVAHASDAALDPSTHNHREALDLGTLLDAVLASPSNHRAGDGVRRARLEHGRDAQDVGAVRAVQRDDVGHRRVALGQGAGLVHGQDAENPCCPRGTRHPRRNIQTWPPRRARSPR